MSLSFSAHRKWSVSLPHNLEMFYFVYRRSGEESLHHFQEQSILFTYFLASIFFCKFQAWHDLKHCIASIGPTTQVPCDMIAGQNIHYIKLSEIPVLMSIWNWLHLTMERFIGHGPQCHEFLWFSQFRPLVKQNVAGRELWISSFSPNLKCKAKERKGSRSSSRASDLNNFLSLGRISSGFCLLLLQAGK